MAYNEKECYVFTNNSSLEIESGEDLVEVDIDGTIFTTVTSDGGDRTMSNWLAFIESAILTATTYAIDFEYKTKEFVEVSIETGHTVQVRGINADLCEVIGLYKSSSTFYSIFDDGWGSYRCVIHNAVGIDNSVFSIANGYTNLLTNVDIESIDLEVDELVTKSIVANSGYLRENSRKLATFEVRFNTFWMIYYVEKFLETAAGLTGESAYIELHNFPDELMKNFGGITVFQLNLGSNSFKFPKTDRFERALWKYTIAAVIGGY